MPDNDPHHGAAGIDVDFTNPLATAAPVHAMVRTILCSLDVIGFTFRGYKVASDSRQPLYEERRRFIKWALCAIVTPFDTRVVRIELYCANSLAVRNSAITK